MRTSVCHISALSDAHSRVQRSKSSRSRDLNLQTFARNDKRVGGHDLVSRTQTVMSTQDPPPQLRGSKPGQLDDAQPSRLLRDPASKLYFASFDPFTARQDDGADRLRSLSLNEQLYRPKRVVVETTPSGSFWRFVPRVAKDDGLKNEENWPRLVDICG